MKHAAFDYFFSLLRDEAGLEMTLEQYYLLETRLHAVMQGRGVTGLEALAGLIQAEGGDRTLRQAVVEAMVPYETSFFRDKQPFDWLLDTGLPALTRARAEDRRLRIWSAGCASGQEPYSVAMLLKEYGAPLDGWDIGILATDISHEILARAKNAAYNQSEVQRGMPARFLVKYFMQEGNLWRPRREIRDMVEFRQANLLAPPPVPAGSMDVVLCRNVLTYLAPAARVKVLEGLHTAMNAEGVLLLGDAETAAGTDGLFRPVAGVSGVYTRRGDVPVAAA